MLSRVLLTAAFLFGLAVFTAAAEPDLPPFVEMTLEIFSDADVEQLTRGWPIANGDPEVCKRWYQSLTPWQNGATDINRFALLIDVERSVLWVELARGLDDMRFFRGPVRLTKRDEWESVDPKSLPSCPKAETSDAA